MSRFTHMTKLKATDRSELYDDFMGLLSTDIPAAYLGHLRLTYGLEPSSVLDAGVRYLGGNWEAVKQELIYRHGKEPLLKTGLGFESGKGVFFLRGEPHFWKSIPLLFVPLKHLGYTGSIVGYAPVTDRVLSHQELPKWLNPSSKHHRGQSKPYFMDEPPFEQVVILHSDPLAVMRLRQQGWESYCVLHWKRFLPSWVNLFVGCRVFITPKDAENYAEDLGPVYEAFAARDIDLTVATTTLSRDYMTVLREYVGLPKDDQPVTLPKHPGKAPGVVKPHVVVPTTPLPMATERSCFQPSLL